MNKLVAIIKPDIIDRKLEQRIIKELKSKIGTIVYQTVKQLDIDILRKFYAEYKNEDFFEANIVVNMTKTPVIALSIETNLSYEEVTDIKKSIREKYGLDRSRNSIHMSDSFSAMLKETEALGWL